MLRQVDCPYCGEPFAASVDISGGSQDYIEDCPVCCRTIEFHLEAGLEGDITSLRLQRDAD
jgi:hypothetical protein